MTLLKNDRILIVAPHPDDEIIGCAGIILKAKEMGLPIKIVVLTHGDSNEWSFLVYNKMPILMPRAVRKMGEIRQKESLAAAKIVGIFDSQFVFLGYPDYSLFDLWNSRWKDRPPLRSILTKVTAVPYKDAFRPGALYKGEDVIKDLKAIFKEFKPTKIFVTHPAEHNTDHKASYLFTRVALWESQIQAKLYPYIVHWKRWPMPKGFFPDEGLLPPDTLRSEIIWLENKLTVQQLQIKRQALKAHKSQYVATPRFLDSFMRRNELFGDFTTIRLSPGQGPLTLLTQSEYYHRLPPRVPREQRAFFIDQEERTLLLHKGHLILHIKFPRPLTKELGVWVNLFGYRADRHFEDMPKIQISFGMRFQRVLNQNQRLSPNLVKVSKGAKDLTLEVPMSVLGDPMKILMSAQTYLGKLMIDSISWRTIEISK